MKKIILVLSILLLISEVSAMANGCGEEVNSNTKGTAINSQQQSQNIQQQNNNENGQISTVNQKQYGEGKTLADVSSYSLEYQNQNEIINTTVQNNYATHNQNTESTTYGGSVSNDGFAAHTENQIFDSKIFTTGDGIGTNSTSGASTTVTQKVEAGSMGNKLTAGYAGAINEYKNDYKYVNIGQTSKINQNGSQSGAFHTQTSAKLTGLGRVSMNAIQSGNVNATNNANGTYMEGSGEATGNISTTECMLKDVTIGIIGSQEQMHTYTQSANNGNGSVQSASGTVFTRNVINSGEIITPE